MIQKYLSIYPLKSHEQGLKAVQFQILTHRPLIKPGCTPFSYEVKEVGAESSAGKLTMKEKHKKESIAQRIAHAKGEITAKDVSNKKNYEKIKLAQSIAHAKGEITARDVLNKKHNEKNNEKIKIAQRIAHAKGEITARDVSNKKNSKKNSKKTAAKNKALRLAANLAYIRSHPELLKLKMSDGKLNSVAKKIYKTPSTYFGGLSPKQGLRSGRFSLYVGITKRDLKAESFRFLTRRGTECTEFTTGSLFQLLIIIQIIH